LSAFHAIRDAISNSSCPDPDLNAPATPESILKAIEASRNELAK
jgi:xanthine dehydrogenase molybdopterin-binding subunit B